ncbi:MAG: hydrogenase maturation protease [Pseudomonadota bacterium]
MIQELYSKPLLVFGCGNTLFGDDGFGPAVIEQLEARHQLPPQAVAIDVGTSIREFLFDLLISPHKPRQILILDAADQPGREPGELFELAIDEISPQKINDFSLHQFPSVNLLQELQTLGGVEVRVLAVKVGHIPDHVAPGLTPQVAAALPRACAWVLSQLASWRSGESPAKAGLEINARAC